MKDEIKFINVNGIRVKLDYVTSYNLINNEDYFTIEINLYSNKRIPITVHTKFEADSIINDLDLLFNPITELKSTFTSAPDINF